ncbi:Uridine kinase [Saliniradius amylolyticus]|uniref:Uridine kinase n=1 Tax=Saliniradius amylolyticus TaxID=2183582 RepID=A0A2S2E5Y0_9ALTE|nr:uridine kinase [Saliniradius amylolyticus]AWL13058.1 Uridine kinase [Saliniradius amylolyticus]
MSVSCVIAIAGASGSGKSLFTQTLIQEALGDGLDVRTLCEDHYYRDQSHLSMAQRQQTNYDHPQAFEHELLEQHLHQLKAGESIDYPQYCFNTHTRKPKTHAVEPAQIILVEGIMLLASPELLPLFDIKVFMDTPPDICLIRRIKRDMQERGRSLDSITEQYEATVKPMYHQFVEPSRFKADVVVTQGGENRIALDILKSHIQQLLNQ